jgi:hypothetical protein
MFWQLKKNAVALNKIKNITIFFSTIANIQGIA